MKIKVGSLFDGIGGTPLAAIMSGAEPVWASEIEKIPVSITERHFPNMKHYGDVTQINGAEIEPVDLIVGGSPCQDLSVAGKRAGLEGERSGLFMDQVRIVKEMRNATRRETEDGTDELPRPRYMVWENVPGTFSSNKGEDFRAVLEEVCRIGEGEVSIPRPPKGKWSKSGTILGDGYSVAWRQVDAQHWGVPQRRRRIYLVADFGGHTAPEICFERESLSRDITEGGEAGQGTATDTERSSGTTGESCVKSAGFVGMMGSKARSIGYVEEQSPTLSAHQAAHVAVYGFEPGIAKREGNPSRFTENLCPTLRANMGDNQAAVAYGIDQPEPYLNEMTSTKNTVVEDGTFSTMKQRDYKDATDLVIEPMCFEPRSPDGVHRIHGDISPTLNTAQGGQRQPCVLTAVEKPTKEDEITGMAGKSKTKGGLYGQTKKTDTREILQLLQQEIGEKGLSEWGFRVLTALRSQKILRQEMYGKVILQTRNGIKVLGHDALEGKAEEVTRQMRDLSEAECQRCSPQGRKPLKQLTREFAAYLSELSQQDSPEEKFVQDLWESSQGDWVLRETLPEIQKIWESVCVQKKSTYANCYVRRLTAKECCRLQGYPDGWTATDVNGKTVSNTQRYKALGNSFAMPNAYFFISRAIKELREAHHEP